MMKWKNLDTPIWIVIGIVAAWFLFFRKSATAAATSAPAPNSSAIMNDGSTAYVVYSGGVFAGYAGALNQYDTNKNFTGPISPAILNEPDYS